MNDLDLQIKDELFKEKFLKIYNIYKKSIWIFSIVITLLPISFQIYFFFKTKENERLFSEYLKAENIFELNNKESIKILNDLIVSSNETIIMLSVNKLLDYYYENNELSKAISLIDSNSKNKSAIFTELLNIKKVLFNYNNDIEENEILQLLSIKKKDLFKKIKTKILHDYYIKNNKFEKAKQLEKNINE